MFGLWVTCRGEIHLALFALTMQPCLAPNKLPSRTPRHLRGCVGEGLGVRSVRGLAANLADSLIPTRRGEIHLADFDKSNIPT